LHGRGRRQWLYIAVDCTDVHNGSFEKTGGLGAPVFFLTPLIGQTRKNLEIPKPLAGTAGSPFPDKHFRRQPGPVVEGPDRPAEEQIKRSCMAGDVPMIGLHKEELPWVRLLVALLRNPDPTVAELARQALLYLSHAPNLEGCPKPESRRAF
jgi:hypothetical protein